MPLLKCIRSRILASAMCLLACGATSACTIKIGDYQTRLKTDAGMQLKELNTLLRQAHTDRYPITQAELDKIFRDAPWQGKKIKLTLVDDVSAAELTAKAVEDDLIYYLVDKKGVNFLLRAKVDRDGTAKTHSLGTLKEEGDEP